MGCKCTTMALPNPCSVEGPCSPRQGKGQASCIASCCPAAPEKITPGITSPTRRAKSALWSIFQLNMYCFCTIVKFRNCNLNHCGRHSSCVLHTHITFTPVNTVLHLKKKQNDIRYMIRFKTEIPTHHYNLILRQKLEPVQLDQFYQLETK